MNIINSNKDFVLIKEQLINIIASYNDKLDDYLSEDSIYNLATHLAITMIRLESKNYIPLSNSQIASIQEDRVLSYAKDICKEIENTFTISIPTGEVAVITMYLAKSHLLDVEIQSGFDLLEPTIFYILKESMETIYTTHNYDFRKESSLYVAIGLHITAAIERLEKGQMLENPLTTHVKENHALEYTFACIINENIKKQYNKEFSDDELAFIAIHFVVAVKEKTAS